MSRRYRATVYSYADVGADGAMESQYVQQPAPDGDGDWWCARALPSGRERTLAAKAEHSVDMVFEFADYVPVSDNGMVVSDGVQYLIRSILARENGRAEVQVLAERTEDVLTRVLAPVMSVSGAQPIVIYAVDGEDDPDVETRTIVNIGGGTLQLPIFAIDTYSDSHTGWLTTSAITGAADPYTFSIGVTMSPPGGSLPPGVYTVNGTISAPNAVAQGVTIQFVVQAAASIVLTPSAFAPFEGTAGGAETAEQTMDVSNGGGGTLQNLAVGNVSVPWLNVALVGGVITASADPLLLTAGALPYSFDVTADNATTVTVSGQFDVDAAASVALSLSKSTTSAAGIINGTNPATEHITISGVGSALLAGPVRGTITYPTGDSGWLTAVITGSGPTYDLALSYNTTGKTAPSSTATFTISDSAATNSPQSFTVTLGLTSVVIPPPPLGWVPTIRTGLASWMSQGPDGWIIGDPYTAPVVTQYTTVVTVSTKAALLAAINNAANGTAIEYSADITIAADQVTRSNSNWCCVRPVGWATLHALRAAGVRVAEADFNALPKLIISGASNYGLRTPGAKYIHWYGVHIKNQQSGGLTSAFVLGHDSPTSVSQLATYQHFDHGWIENPYVNGGNKLMRRGVAANAQFWGFVDSLITGCLDGQASGSPDSQAINSISGLGDSVIRNCGLEAASEVVMFGGGPTALGAQDYNHRILLDRNYHYRRDAWLTEVGSQKNFFENKNGRYIVMQRSRCKNHRGDGQQQNFVLKYAVYGSGQQSYTVCRDILLLGIQVEKGVGDFTTSTAPDVGGVSNFALENIQLAHILSFNPYTGFVTNSDRRSVIGAGGSGAANLRHKNVTIENVTIPPGNSLITNPMNLGQIAYDNLHVDNNIAYRDISYNAVQGQGGNNATSLAQCSVGGVYSFRKNVVRKAASDPFDATLGPLNIRKTGAITFANEATGDYTVDASETTIKAQGTDGRDPGVDMPFLTAAIAGV